MSADVGKRKLDEMMATNKSEMTDAYTVTFGDRAENGVGMEMIGQAAARGLTVAELENLAGQLENDGADPHMVYLSPLANSTDVPSAAVLVLKNGVEYMFESMGEHHMNAEGAYKELTSMPKDSLMFQYGKVMKKHCRHNNTMSNFDQKADIANKQGTVVNLADYPCVSKLREAASNIMSAPQPLVGELNHYYDAKKCGIGWHGDAERRLVYGVRLGPGAENFPLKFQWFVDHKPLGDEGRCVLQSGDVYIMSAKAVGNDWKTSSVPTLRHAAGKDTCKYATTKRKPGEGVHTVKVLYK